jgi:N-acetylmuramoyl-L-alanine amidase
MRWGKEIVLGLMVGLLLSGQGVARTRHHVKQAYHQPKKQTASVRVHSPVRPRVARRAEPKPADPRPLIVIDPGHGGADPGAVGVAGTLEKTVTLATALDLRRELLATGRYRAVLTRTTDRAVSLPERLAFARARDADMLIAIHADAARDHDARGASVYVRGGDAMTSLEASAGLQGSMIEQLADDVRMVPAPARAARFYVLAAGSIPSVLLEMGFLSNRRDEALLRQPQHRHVVVEAIKDAVNDYFANKRAGGGRT